jgi:hypothetical protein
MVYNPESVMEISREYPKKTYRITKCTVRIKPIESR